MMLNKRKKNAEKTQTHNISREMFPNMQSTVMLPQNTADFQTEEVGCFYDWMFKG